jgi:hypothetical protein
MGQIKGAKEYKMFEQGKKLSPAKAILAKCYECNGYNESGIDCEVEGCPLYPVSKYRQRSGTI